MAYPDPIPDYWQDRYDHFMERMESLAKVGRILQVPCLPKCCRDNLDVILGVLDDFIKEEKESKE